MNALVWFRSDLRVDDNAALHHACRTADGEVTALFVLAPSQWREHGWGSGKVAFVLRSVAALSRRLEGLGIPLLVRLAPRFDDAPKVVVTAVREVGADGVFINEEYEVNERRRDRMVREALGEYGVGVASFHDQTVLPPASLRTGGGRFYSTFTPFRRTWERLVADGGALDPFPGPASRGAPRRDPEPVPEVLAPFGECAGAAAWPAGELEAERRLSDFVASPIADYHERRDHPAEAGTSTLSPYLAVGSASVRRCLAAARAAGGVGAYTWEGELAWREFYRHVLVGYPRVCMNQPFRLETRRVPWDDDDEAFSVWCEGRTGFPIVDAGMRQLMATGWMHNRARMIVASFLTKDLLIDWRRGERFFMERLVDGDFANNNGGWQWAASTGTDAVPYFRIFNPTTQSRRFDPEGVFLRRWLPELEGVETAAIHDPPPELRRKVGYPAAIVDHAAARKRALQAFTSAG